MSQRPMKRLIRSSNNAWLGGVCAGLGEYFNLDPVFFRVAVVIASLFGGVGVVFYAAMYFFTPSSDAIARRGGAQT